PARQADRLYELAYLFQLCHALVVVVIGLLLPYINRNLRLIGFAALGFVVGMALFSGSLYWLALHGPGSLGRLSLLTPVGGTSLLIGWVALVVLGLRENFARK
ncbi:MAG: DUF423 domain-containing protein, partial [Alphaproteobacteria bacterium]